MIKELIEIESALHMHGIAIVYTICPLYFLDNLIVPPPPSHMGFRLFHITNYFTVRTALFPIISHLISNMNLPLHLDFVRTHMSMICQHMLIKLHK